MDVTKGYLLTTDISGYTKFLVESELGHAKEILDTLLRTTIDAVKAPVRVLKPMGDAIMCFVRADEFLQPQSLFEAMREIYFEFRRHLDFMRLNTTCECDACVNMAALDMKVFLHYGEFAEQDLDGTTELQGRDVILGSLLMKNDVTAATGLAGYALITRSAVNAMGADELVAGTTDHVENYEHFGDVEMFVWDLPAEWDAELQRRRGEIDPMAKWVTAERHTPAPQWKAWDVATDTDSKRIYYDMKSVERVDDLGGSVREGSKYHCVHEMGDVTFTITDWNPPHSFESDEVAMGIPVHFTMQFVPVADGTILRIMYDTPDYPDPVEVEPLFQEAAEDALERLAGLLAGVEV